VDKWTSKTGRRSGKERGHKRTS